MIQYENNRVEFYKKIALEKEKKLTETRILKELERRCKEDQERKNNMWRRRR